MKLRKFKASFDSAKTGTTLVTIFRDLKIYDFDMFLLIVDDTTTWMECSRQTHESMLLSDPLLND